MTYAFTNECVERVVSKLGRDNVFAVITFGLLEEYTNQFRAGMQQLVDYGLKACIHYTPKISAGASLLLTDLEAKYIPYAMHFESRS